ncbi:sensor histidine kinase [Clostridium oceanicum]|uniref:histidine kinase n=1 Tax=Clostridium oceanicum TaxID=1543 RepID=A0ABP3UXZ1_9CLOT
MKNKKSLVVFRYISIILIICSIIFLEKTVIDTYAVILILLFIINNQVRFFILNENKNIVTVSLVIECVISYFIYINYGGITFFYFSTISLDSAFLLGGKSSYIPLGLSISIMVLQGKYENIGEILISICCFIILFILAIYIKEENKRKKEAQKLYDELRISEEKLKRANKDLESYSKSIEELTILRERNRISREIHDSVGHSLSTMIIQLGAIEKVACKDGKKASIMCNNLCEFSKESLKEVRMAVQSLKPREFEKYEGILAIENLIKNFEKLTEIKVSLGFTKERVTLNSDRSFVIYRIVQEFLSNSLRHGKAKNVNIFMNFSDFDRIVITLKDDGIGTDNITRGMGLKGIFERVSELGGEAYCSSKKGEGFLLKAIFYNKNKLENML